MRRLCAVSHSAEECPGVESDSKELLKTRSPSEEHIRSIESIENTYPPAK